MGATRSSTLTCGPGALCDPAWPVLLEVAGEDFDLQPVVRLAIVKRTNRKTREYRGTKLMADSLKTRSGSLKPISTHTYARNAWWQRAGCPARNAGTHNSLHSHTDPNSFINIAVQCYRHLMPVSRAE